MQSTRTTKKIRKDSEVTFKLYDRDSPDADDLMSTITVSIEKLLKNTSEKKSYDYVTYFATWRDEYEKLEDDEDDVDYHEDK